MEKSPNSSTSGANGLGQPKSTSYLQKWNARVEGLSGFEARGLERVPPEERESPSAMGLLQMLLLWFSANLTINNLAVALTGPLVFGLGFNDCAWCSVIGVFLGSVSTAYMSTWGAVSGNRTMVCRSTGFTCSVYCFPCSWELKLTSGSGRREVPHGLLSFKDLYPS